MFFIFILFFIYLFFRDGALTSKFEVVDDEPISKVFKTHCIVGSRENFVSYSLLFFIQVISKWILPFSLQ
jgi:hypothetical protein